MNIASSFEYEVRRLQTADGLSLCYRDYGPRLSDAVPVLCLPGLTRNVKDFHALAMHLSKSRRVLALDARGRGASDYDPVYANYNLVQETSDTLGLLSQIGKPAAIIGTSRGGLSAMILHGVRADLIAGIVFNDIGPEIDPEGIVRIMGYLGVTPEPFEDWEDATAALMRTQRDVFPGLADAEWEAWARRTYRDDDGRPALDYDVKLRDATIEAAGGGSDFWPQFRALCETPLLLLRGANSDLLSTGTVAKMRRMRPDMQVLTIKGRGHVPFLDESESLAGIDAFLAELDSAASSES